MVDPNASRILSATAIVLPWRTEPGLFTVPSGGGVVCAIVVCWIKTIAAMPMTNSVKAEFPPMPAVWTASGRPPFASRGKEVSDEKETTVPLIFERTKSTAETMIPAIRLRSFSALSDSRPRAIFKQVSIFMICCRTCI